MKKHGQAAPTTSSSTGRRRRDGQAMTEAPPTRQAPQRPSRAPSLSAPEDQHPQTPPHATTAGRRRSEEAEHQNCPQLHERRHSRSTPCHHGQPEEPETSASSRSSKNTPRNSTVRSELTAPPRSRSQGTKLHAVVVTSAATTTARAPKPARTVDRQAPNTRRPSTPPQRTSPRWGMDVCTIIPPRPRLHHLDGAARNTYPTIYKPRARIRGLPTLPPPQRRPEREETHESAVGEEWNSVFAALKQ